jgi:hypothetical protein
MTFKGSITLFAAKEYWYKKFKGQKVLCKKLFEFSFKSDSKRLHFTGIKNK